MDRNQTNWIDPATARRLLLEYRQALAVKGASEIERQIDRHTRLGISRKTIENWLHDADSTPSPQTLKIVLRFLQTEHFQKMVPRTRDYLEADARLYRRGAALFDLHGAQDLDANEYARLNSLIDGWWSGPVSQRDMGTHETSYLHTDLVPGQPFSRMFLCMRAEHLLMGSGIVFPLKGSEEADRFEARIWSRSTLQENVMTIMSAMSSPRNGGLMLVYQDHDQPHRILHETFFPADENLVPEEVRSTFESWRGDAIPHDPTGRIEA
ncbi:hypothetical protein [Eoetvoesiella caeni]|uniref:Uncharacterized protein n=1 Tax=Eoetvoesiella caeni TaxID=645616 RepID=A0A366HFE5_9BURK|nr:hypothetical protein [Eoetvoesiella caeni]MCI2808929.1 hypothetical protein [Eoetvoesiella caeni]NYT55570.1 hypothetical protein [Eoetvoesiella caeni]RBP40125.1 hypothetical protein DFR37_104222 [Eoetvoesiella caeni]